ncbi:hypothetical protein K456DRAFT_40401 [Colletotrichum gloeosporioides 23]|nr:hypothetical protein K456DRAFT_40401 [Colletotrichum gloeosporioides 23]
MKQVLEGFYAGFVSYCCLNRHVLARLFWHLIQSICNIPLDMLQEFQQRTGITISWADGIFHLLIHCLRKYVERAFVSWEGYPWVATAKDAVFETKTLLAHGARRIALCLFISWNKVIDIKSFPAKGVQAPSAEYVAAWDDDCRAFLRRLGSTSSQLAGACHAMSRRKAIRPVITLWKSISNDIHFLPADDAYVAFISSFHFASDMSTTGLARDFKALILFRHSSNISCQMLMV